MADQEIHKDNISLGQKLPHIVLPDHRGRRFDFLQLRGRALVVFYFLNNTRALCAQQIQAFKTQMEEFRAQGVTIIGISQDEVLAQKECVERLSIPFPLLADPHLTVAKELGIARWINAGPKEAVEVTRTTLVIDGDLRIRAIYKPKKDLKDHVKGLVQALPNILPELLQQKTAPHAPLLMIPTVIEPGLCQRILAEKKISQPFLSYIDKRLYTRVVPEVIKAFQYKPTRRELPIILTKEVTPPYPVTRFCSNSTPQTAHRRYAVQIWLNTDAFKGGGISFPEFGRGIYKPRIGDALVYSCGLLQENILVKEGEEHRLVSYFYDEQMAQVREDTARKRGAEYRKGPAKDIDDPIFEK